MLWVILILGIWVCAALGSFATKDAEWFAYAGIVTVLIGIGYLIIHDY